MAFLITFLGTISYINDGVICHFIFFSVRYLTFFVPLWNLACETLGLVLFLFHLLCSIPFCCFRLWNFPCQIFGLVLFVFDLLYPICLCGLRLNLACEIHLLVVLFLFDLLCVISLSCLQLWNLACGIGVGLVLFIFDLLCAITLSGIRLLKFLPVRWKIMYSFLWISMD